MSRTVDVATFEVKGRRSCDHELASLSLMYVIDRAAAARQIVQVLRHSYEATMSNGSDTEVS